MILLSDTQKMVCAMQAIIHQPDYPREGLSLSDFIDRVGEIYPLDPNFDRERLAEMMGLDLHESFIARARS